MAGALAPTALARAPRRAGATPATQRLHLAFPLVARDAALERFATAVSTPGNPLYGHYRSIGWLSRTFGASAATRRRAVRFLRGHGATEVRASATGLFVDATMPAARADRMFRAPLARAQATAHAQATGSRRRPSGGAVRIPKRLRGVATGVVGLDTAPLLEHPTLIRPREQARDDPMSSAYQPVTGTPEGCSQEAAVGGFTPNEYLSAYGFSALQAAGLRGHGERVALIEIDGFKPSDISAFASCFALTVPPIKPIQVGLPKPLPAGGETELDLEMLITAAPDLSGVDVYEAPPQAGSVLQALGKPLTAQPRPDVISASLGLCESQTLASIGRFGLQDVQAELEEATAMGISVVSSSGDDGSSGCINEHSSSQQPLPQLTVDYPASSKWVTAVGGTNVQLNADNTIATQTTWNDQADFGSPGSPEIGATGGGFSGLFPRPGYQNGTITQNQRALPDVGLLADVQPGYVTYCTAKDCTTAQHPSPWEPVGGTSAAAPLLAGGFALIDQYLREHQLDNLGLANPLLYSIGRNPALAPTVFDDVTVGSNDVGSLITSSGRALGCCSAAPGFDEATGWGGVNLATLEAIAATRQPQIVRIALALNPQQRPYSAGGIFARLHCDRTCLATASATVTIGRLQPFTDRASVSHLKGGQMTITKIAFTHSQMRVLEEALKAHVKVSATVTGGVVNGRGATEQLTAVKTLKITG